MATSKVPLQKESTLPPERALRAITEQLDGLQKLKGRRYDEADPEETEWEHLTQSIIEGAFGDPSSALSKFRMARHAGQHSTTGTSPQSRQINFETRIKEQEALLRSLTGTLRLQLPEDTQNAPTLGTAKREIITNTLAQVRSFRFCGPSDDPDEQTAVTLGYRHLVIQLKRLVGPILPEAIASRLDALDVEVNNLYSAFEANAELDALLPDIESALEAIDGAANALPTKALKQVLKDRDLAGVDKEFERALANVEKDPPAAITAACSILEALFKVYIEDNGIEIPADQSLKPLWKTASKHLALDPAAIEDDDVKKVLSGLNSVVDGIGSLRTHTGSAHGRGRRAYHLQARHARLAIHASHTLVGFFIETWDERKRKATA